MRTLSRTVLGLIFTLLAGCGQQLVEFGNAVVPTVTSTDPLNAATNVGVSRTINATFSEQMNPASLTAATFTLKQGSTSIDGSVKYAGMTATFTPTSNLSSNEFTATVTTGAKSAGSSTGLAADYTWKFTTSAVNAGNPPAVNSTDPGNSSTGVAVGKQVTATFSTAMDPATINTNTFLLKQGTAAIAGAVTIVGATARFVPNSLLDTNKLYDATITIGAKDPAGLAITSDYKWSFTTEAVPPPPPPPLAINLRSAASFGIASHDAMTSTGVTVVNGDVAIYPYVGPDGCTDSTGNNGASQFCLTKIYSSVTGLTVNGSIYFTADPYDNGGTANSVTNDLNIAWVEGKNKTTNKGPVGGQLSSVVPYQPGVYRDGALNMAAGGTATLDAAGDANAVFIFKVDTSLTDSGTTLLPSKIALINGAQARNVWFVVGLDVTIGHGTTWNGNILAGNSATILDGSTVTGRVLGGAAGAGAIVLTGKLTNTTTITVPQ